MGANQNGIGMLKWNKPDSTLGGQPLGKGDGTDEMHSLLT